MELPSPMGHAGARGKSLNEPTWEIESQRHDKILQTPDNCSETEKKKTC